ncbi:Rne/Rng family ribonuclease [Streptomyces sp. ME01-24h]|nr:Rne/Rng family ribonuclease [Streptomyces sp. ME01-24h]
MLEQNEPNEAPETGATEAASGGTDTEATAAPRRRRRAASRPAGPPAAGEAAEDMTPGAAAPTVPAEAPSGEPAAEAAPARGRRRATRKASAPEPQAAGSAEETAEAAPAPARRRATRKTTAPAAAPEAPDLVESPATETSATETPGAEQAEPSAAPARGRRRATRKVATPEPAAAVEDVAVAGADTQAKQLQADLPLHAETPGAEQAEPSAAPARGRRRATRKVATPEPAAAVEDVAVAGADTQAKELQADLPLHAETPGAEQAEPSAAPARGRRRATRKVATPEPAAAVEDVAAAAADAPAKALQEEPASKPKRGRGEKPRSEKSTAARSRRRTAPAASFLAADDGSRRLKPGALAPREEAEAETGPEAAASAAPEQRAYTAKAIPDGSGWAVEVEEAYEIRGYGDTVEQARAAAVAAVAEAFGVPADTVVIEVREPQGDEVEAEAVPQAEVEPEPAPARGRRRVVRPPVAVFQAPVFQAPAQTAAPASAPAAQAVPADAPEEQEAPEAEAEEYAGGRRRRRRRRGEPAEAVESAPTAVTAHADEEPEAPHESDAEAEADEHEADDHEHETDGERTSRRRRRGGRRRRRGEAADGEETADEDEDAEGAAEDSEDDEERDAEGSSTSRRRRRRRRRGGEGTAEEGLGEDAPERTVVKIREPRKASEPVDEVQSIKGSTRLEAKKQRRREGREQGRRRVPIITEAEFLARREAVERVMVVRENGDRTQIGVLEDDVLVEHYVNKEQATSYVGNVYLGKVQNVLPSMEAAFVDIGKGRNAVLYAGEVNFEALGMGNGPRRIEAALKSGQSVLVQVTKDPIGHKGARLTSQVSLPGRYLVYVPEGSMTGISRKLPDTERARLKQILKKIVPEDAGVIVRTAAEGASEDELRRDVERLQAQWEEIQQKAKSGNAPSLLYGEPDMTVRVVRDIFNEDFTKVIVSGDTAWQTIHGYVSQVAPDLAERLSRWTSEVDVFATYRIDEQLLKALDRKVWLPSGGSLVIDRTEAMVVVDVNTGKFTGQGGNLEETVTRNNLEAAEEIVRQLRLRDLGGIIVIDFIDMVLESNRDLVMRRLLECLGRDRTKHQVAEVTSLGLVQMTRKRVGQGLLESFSETCVHCNGRGVIVHMDQATAAGGGGKRKRRRGGAAEEPAVAGTAAVLEAEEAAEELPELEPVAVTEADLVPAVGGDEEWFSSPAEAEAAAGRRSRRRVSRRVTAPVSSPDATAEIVTVVPSAAPVTEPQAAEAATATAVEASAPAPVGTAEVAEDPAAPVRGRRRATRKATAPSAPAGEAATVVVPAAEPVVTAPEPELAPEPVAEVQEPAVPVRRRATRRVSAPAGAPSSGEAAAVVVVPATEAQPETTEAEQAEPKKRAPRKTAAKKAPAKKAAAKKTTATKTTATKTTAAKKTAAKKTTAKKATAKKAVTKAAAEAPTEAS